MITTRSRYRSRLPVARTFGRHRANPLQRRSTARVVRVREARPASWRRSARPALAPSVSSSSARVDDLRADTELVRPLRRQPLGPPDERHTEHRLPSAISSRARSSSKTVGPVRLTTCGSTKRCNSRRDHDVGGRLTKCRSPTRATPLTAGDDRLSTVRGCPRRGSAASESLSSGATALATRPGSRASCAMVEPGFGTALPAPVVGR